MSGYHLAILDINLPDGSGYEPCRLIREKANTPVIFLTANDLEGDMIKGYELGAVDYTTKPFPNSILCHKVRAIFQMLEHTEMAAGHSVYDDGLLKIDFSSLHAVLQGKEIDFSPLEYRMLEVFRPGKMKAAPFPVTKTAPGYGLRRRRRDAFTAMFLARQRGSLMIW